MKQIFFLMCMVLFVSGNAILAQTSENSGSLKAVVKDMATGSSSFDKEGHRADFVSMMKSYKRIRGIAKK
jgi:hypothetical protein